MLPPVTTETERLAQTQNTIQRTPLPTLYLGLICESKIIRVGRPFSSLIPRSWLSLHCAIWRVCREKETKKLKIDRAEKKTVERENKIE